MTTLGELRVGDRFMYKKRADIWQVTGREGKNRQLVTINQVLPWGDKIHKFDELKPAGTLVRFLRHTVPVAGECWKLEELRPGDVFIDPFDVMTELEFVEHKYPAGPVKCRVASNQSAPAYEYDKDLMVTIVNPNQN